MWEIGLAILKNILWLLFLTKKHNTKSLCIQQTLLEFTVLGFQKMRSQWRAVLFLKPAFLGPKQKNILEEIAPHFKYNLDLGFVYGIGEFLIVVLNFFHSIVGDWGFAIVLLTLAFKLLLSPLQIMQINRL